MITRTLAAIAATLIVPGLASADCLDTVSEADYYACLAQEAGLSCSVLVNSHQTYLACLAEHHGADWYGDDLAPSSEQACLTLEGIIPCAGEEDHWIADRFEVPFTPFVPSSIRYALFHGTSPSVPAVTCDAGLAHNVQVFIGSSSPSARPAIVDSWRVQGPVWPSSPTQVIELTRHASYQVERGEYLYVSIQHAGRIRGMCGSSTNGVALCTAACPTEDGEVAFWSFAGEPDYRWRSLRSVMVLSHPLVSVYGYRAP